METQTKTVYCKTVINMIIACEIYIHMSYFGSDLLDYTYNTGHTHIHKHDPSINYNKIT